MVQVTEKAAVKAREVLQRMGAPEAAVRVLVNLKGCNCSRYRMAVDPQVRPEDRVVEVGGVRFVADPQAAELLVGAVLDYHEENGDGGFVIQPPVEAAHDGGCGCGAH